MWKRIEMSMKYNTCFSKKDYNSLLLSFVWEQTVPCRKIAKDGEAGSRIKILPLQRMCFRATPVQWTLVKVGGEFWIPLRFMVDLPGSWKTGASQLCSSGTSSCGRRMQGLKIPDMCGTRSFTLFLITFLPFGEAECKTLCLLFNIADLNRF